MSVWTFRDPDTGVEICLAPTVGQDKIEIILPSTIYVTAEDAERIGKALLFAAWCLKLGVS